MLKFILASLLALISASALLGQTDSTEESLKVVEISSDADSAFSQARELAYAGDYEASRKILDLLIYQNPTTYYQYKLFKTRTLVWEGKHETARDIIEEVILEDTTVMDIYEIRLNNERYDKDYDMAVRYADDGINRFPKQNEFFHVGKVQAQVSQNEYHDALSSADVALDSFPDNNELKQLKTFLLNQLIVDGLAVGVSMDYFTKNIPVWLTGFVQYGKQTKIGAVIGRINVVDRNYPTTEDGSLNGVGIQGEVDVYPRLGRKSYMYLNAGYSPSLIFPNFRFGAEVFSMLGKSKFEGSVGVRYLDFIRNQVVMYTGSLGYYWENEYISFRPFFIYDVINGWGSTYNFLYRKFYSGKGDFLQLTAGFGVIPDERILSASFGTTPDTDYRLDNQYIGVGFQKLVNPKFYTRLDLTLTRQESFSRQNDYINIITLGLTLGYRL